MGKSLVINGINAAPANLGTVNLQEEGLDITNRIQLVSSTSGYGTQYLHYPTGMNDAIQCTTSINGRKMGFIDVSDFVGSVLKANIKRSARASDYSPEAYWICFASAISSTSVGKTTVQNGVTPVQRISGLGSDVEAFSERNLIIPSGAKYFVFSYSVSESVNYTFRIVD
jgi:hypothetical protein